jgi:hypothetical protein
MFDMRRREFITLSRRPRAGSRCDPTSISPPVKISRAVEAIVARVLGWEESA